MRAEQKLKAAALLLCGMLVWSPTAWAAPPLEKLSPLGKLVIELGRNGVPADGQSAMPVTIKLLGTDGQRLDERVMVTVEHSGGRLLLPGALSDEAGPRGLDADRVTPGVQVAVEHGELHLNLLAPSTPQDVVLRVSAGDQSVQGELRFVPDARDMIAAGLIEGVLSLSGGAGGGAGIQPLRRGDVFEREINRWARDFNDGQRSVGARAAVFLKGMVSGDYLLTAAYDSDKDVRARLLRDVQPDKFYPVYGDSALRGFDARSADRLYVRVDHQRSYLLYGDFATGAGFSQAAGGGGIMGLKQRSLGAYNRTATGVRHHLQGEGGHTDAFAFNDTLHQVVEEFVSQGSGPYGLSNNAVLEGSDKVEIVVRDRNQPARILSVTPLTRLVDYSFEPFSGRIVLATYLPAFDAQLNPQSLRVSYEVDQGGTPFWVTGVEGQWRVTDGLELGAFVVKDRNPLAPLDLASVNAGLSFGPHTRAVLELAGTRREINTNTLNASTAASSAGLSGMVSGKAWRAEVQHEGDWLDARLVTASSEAGFLNAAAPLDAGRRDAAAKLAAKLSATTQLYGEALRSEDRNPGGGLRSAAGAGLRWRVAAVDGLTLDAGLRRVRETAGVLVPSQLSPITPLSGSSGLGSSLGAGAGGGALGYGNNLIDPATGLAQISPGSSLQGNAGIGALNVPAGTQLASDTARLGLGYALTPRSSLGAELEQQISGEVRQRVAVGADYAVAERARLYGRFERQTGLSSLYGITAPDRQVDAFALGASSTSFQDTQLFSEYRLRDAASGRDLQLASGVRQAWDLSEGLRLTTALERLNVLQGPAPDASALSVGLDMHADPLWKGSTRLELRRAGDRGDTADDDRFQTALWQLMLARKLDRDWTLLARNYLLNTTYAAKGAVQQDRAQIGVAYRETDVDRLSGLARYELKNERDASNAALGELHSRAHIVSTHLDWHASRPWWLYGRMAAKWQDDRFEGGVQDHFQSQLLSSRLSYDVTEQWDVAALASVQWGQLGARETALGLEAGRLMAQNLWLSAGVNVSGFAGDVDLTGYEYTRRGFFLRLRFKFDEDLFAGSDPRINRSLDRNPDHLGAP
ncbi:hypothetical protein [Leptothrix ochracea]|uniref:hypothetical protein n=1 Tax=Leptothrix ochracea TaxID=735331 RepID=UPI0034E26A59